MIKYFGFRLLPANRPVDKLNIYLFSLLLFCSPSIYSQVLSAENIYKKVSGAVVVILAYDYNNQLSKQGSGVVIDDKGYVVTNYHVLEGCERLEIHHIKEIVPYVDIIGIDVEKDILILKIKAQKFPAIEIGDSEKLNIGQRVYAIGNPLGFENTISEGIISGLRSHEESGRSFIQITASISSGSSGGAVVNDKGELIGISTLSVSEGQNLNFAIPIHDVLSVSLSSYLDKEIFKVFELFSKGLKAYFKNDYTKAIKDYSNFIELYPNYDIVYSNRGNAKYKLEDYRGAIQDYNKAIEINPSNEINYFNRGISKNKLEDYNGALQDFDRAIKLNPNYIDAYNMRGVVKFNIEDYKGAIRDYNKAIELNPNFEDAYVNRGNANLALENCSSAIKDYNQAIKINPNDNVAYRNRGLAKLVLGDYYGACTDFSKAGELGDNDAYRLIRKYCN